MSDAFATLKIDTRDHVTTVTLARPQLLNRFDGAAHTEWMRVLALLQANTDHRVVLIEAEGKLFSAGGDLDEVARIQADPDVCRRMFDEGRQLVRDMLALKVPVVVALHGDAIGLGATIVLLCDIVVAAKSAGLCDPHVAIGLVAGDGGCIGWPAAAGMMRAKRYLLTGERIDATTAHAAGLVTDLCDTPEDTIAEARRLAARIAALAPIAVQGTKRALNRHMTTTYAEAFDISCAAEEQSALSEDVAEGVAALRARRAPVFRGV